MMARTMLKMGLLLGAGIAAAGCDASSTSGYGQQDALGGAGGTLFTATGGTAVAPAGGSGMPCDVEAIIAAKCQTCHNAQKIAGAPMALLTQADFQGTWGAQPVYMRSQVRINATAAADKMPPPMMPALTDAEKAVLNAWLGAGAPASTEVCTSLNPDTGAGGATVGGTGGIAATGGMTVVDERPVDADECFTFRAHALGDVNTPFTPPPDETYWNFSFTKPWEGDPQAITIRHLIDNPSVVHHTLIYQSEGTVPAGVTQSIGLHGSDALLAGWAPGGSDTVMPPDVGLRLPKGDFTMEVHYFNNIGGAPQDASGFEICVTYEDRPNTAGIHWLGSEPFGANRTEWTSTCTPNYSNGPITIMTSWPHMHLLGRHMTTTINRGGNPANAEILYDGEFDFEYQATYPTPAVLQPGDTLTTTCQFSAPASFGTRTTDEMCYNFVIAYPDGAFSSGGGLTSGVNHCMW